MENSAMSATFASALPRKQFFLEMFTRDIRLIDCILDLVDNSIDSLIRRDKIDLQKEIVEARPPLDAAALAALPLIEISFDSNEFKIEDNCGGIAVKDAQDEAFNFGHDPDYDPGKHGSRLGAYGIGMKRAIFKIGNHFQITSRTAQDGFTMDVDVREWAKNDKSPKDWRLPMETTERAKSKRETGTSILITDFTDSVKLAIKAPTLTSELIQQISRTYGLFLNRFVKVVVNNAQVDPQRIPIGEGKGITPERRHYQWDGVSVDIVATLAAKSAGGTWQGEAAGWYIICNGRIVVYADKSELTGWDRQIVPQFQPKFRGFIGIVNYFSKDPLELPWTTTKRSLNRDSPAFLKIRSEMQAAAKPIIKLLESFYGPERDESEPERKTIESMKPGDVTTLLEGAASSFRVASKSVQREEPVDTQINFTVKIVDLERVRKHLRSPKMSKSKVGEHVFEYFMRSEGLSR
jgi:hypothetical protein